MTLKEVMSNRFVSFYAKSIFSYIYAFKDDPDHCDKTSADICGDLSLSVNTVKKYLTELVDNGLIEFKPTGISSKFSTCIYNVKVNCETSEQPKKTKTKSTHSSNSKSELASQFQELWDLYPRKQGKKDAFEKFKRVIRDGSATVAEIRDGINRYIPYAKKKGHKFTLMGSTFFNQERWQDQWEMNEFESWYVTEGKRLKEKQQKEYIEISCN